MHRSVLYCSYCSLARINHTSHTHTYTHTYTHTHTHVQTILNHPWVGLSEDEKIELGIVSGMASQSPITTRKSGLAIDISDGSPLHPVQRVTSTDSPLPGSPDDEFSLTRSNTVMSHITIDSTNHAVDQELIKTMYHNQSARERKVYEDFNHDKTDIEKVHLPPIEPQTPNVGQARKILLRGADLAHKLSNQHQSPAGTPVSSPAPGQNWRHETPHTSPHREGNRLGGGSVASSVMSSPMSSSVSSPDIRLNTSGHNGLQLDMPSSKFNAGPVVSPLIHSKPQYSSLNNLHAVETLPLITEQIDQEKEDEEKSLLSGRGSLGSKSVSETKEGAKGDSSVGSEHRRSSRGNIDIGESKTSPGSRRGSESRLLIRRGSKGEILDGGNTASPTHDQAEGKNSDVNPPPYTQKA